MGLRSGVGARRVVVVALLCLSAVGCAPAAQHGALGDFALESGETILDCQIGYRTFGQLDATRSNAVLVPTWAMGTSRDLAPQIGPGKLVDSSRYFVIAVDALANGVSSSPSNSARQPGTAFPTVSMRDMVESQYQLVTRVLGLPRLKAIVGVSLGGMQAVAWSIVHPEFVEKVIAIAGTPRSSARDTARWEAGMRDLDGRFASPWRRAAHKLSKFQPVTAIQEFGFEIEDFRRQAQAIARFDVSLAFGGSMERAAAAVRSQMLMVVPQKDDVVDPAPALAFARLARAQLIELDGRCGHSAPSCERATLWPAIARFLER